MSYHNIVHCMLSVKAVVLTILHGYSLIPRLLYFILQATKAGQRPRNEAVLVMLV